MKKNILLVLITAIICIVGTASAAYVYTARDIGYQPQDENWEVGNAREALDSLKTDLNQVSTDVNTYKSEIITALNNNGSELTNNSSMEDIVNTINNSGGELQRVNVGSGQLGETYGSSKTINIANLYPDKYHEFTSSNFVAIVSSGQMYTGTHDNYRPGFGLSCSYNSSTGILTVSGGLGTGATKEYVLINFTAVLFYVD